MPYNKRNASHAAGAAKTDQLRASILKRLVENNIVEVRIEFDGSGDEGQVENIVGTLVDGTLGSLDWPCNIPGKVKKDTSGSQTSQSGEASREEDRFLTMRELLDDWTYTLLEDVGVDWINNDGGFGEIVLIPSEDVIRCEMNIRFIDSEHSEYEL